MIASTCSNGKPVEAIRAETASAIIGSSESNAVAASQRMRRFGSALMNAHTSSNNPASSNATKSLNLLISYGAFRDASSAANRSDSRMASVFSS